MTAASQATNRARPLAAIGLDGSCYDGKFYFVKQPSRRSVGRTVLHHCAKPVRAAVRTTRSVLRRLS